MSSCIENIVALVKDNIGRVVVGKTGAIELLLVALICEGHVLLEDVPGVGKTLLAKALARSLGCSFHRIQFTPDLLPSDVTGSRIFNQKTSEFEFRAGPIFGQVILADEINRASPRTQAGLLEAMEERQVTADGVTMLLARPFMVLATQNPVELEGTFPLPEAQLDRFLLRLSLGYPSAEEEDTILIRMGRNDPFPDLRAVLDVDELHRLQARACEVHVADDIRKYIIAIVRASREWPDVQLGASPRASLALYRCSRALALLKGRDYVLPDDVKALAPHVLGHRIVLSVDARIRGRDPGATLTDLLKSVAVPVEEIPVSVTSDA
jgi:MoxR-like ATPase